MKEQRMTDALLRRFLLGKVDDEERQRIESLFLTDPASREKVLAVEQELIEDYLDDRLSAADKGSFLLHYADTPKQRRKLRIAKTVQNWAITEASATSTEPATISLWSRLRARIRSKPVFVIPIAAAAMIAIMITAVWVNRKREQRSTEQQLARLNAPSSLREVPPQMSPIDLAPVTVRNAENQTELKLRSDVSIVDLRLLWLQPDRYPKYQAVVRRFDSDNSFNIPNLQPQEDRGHKIPLRLRAEFLTRGLYQIQLSGVAADGSISPPQEYTFTVAEQ